MGLSKLTLWTSWLLLFNPFKPGEEAATGKEAELQKRACYRASTITFTRSDACRRSATVFEYMLKVRGAQDAQLWKLYSMSGAVKKAEPVVECSEG
jgi:hypothetical protein